MRKLYLIMVVICALAYWTQSYGQQVRIVKIDGWNGTGDIEAFNNVLIDAIDADSTARKTNPNVIYELNRGQSYPMGKIIKNYDYRLHIRAAAGTGLKPIITPGKKADGTYGNDFIQAYNDVTLENIEVSGHTPTGSVLNRMFETYGKKSRIIMNGCAFDGDRGGMIAVWGDSMKVYAYDCTFGNTGHRKTTGGNGRSIDLRPSALYVDTLIVQNCTHYNQTDRLIRNMGSVVNYLKWDHNTAINNTGFHGSLQLGEVRKAIVTNNIFANCISLGHYNSRTQEQTQPEKHFSIITLDTIFAGQSIVIRNNNIYNDKVITDVWAKYDSVSAPWEITPTIKTAIGEANVAAAWFAEPLSFKTFCAPISEYIDAHLTNPKASSFPENWCVGGEGGYYSDEIDASYGLTAKSYTAGDGGFPLGDLNYYPEKKAEWKDWISTAVYGFKNLGTDIKVYPNPFSDNVKLIVKTDQPGEINVAIYDLSGKMINQLVKQYVSSGIHEYMWNGDNSNGIKVNNGMYLYRAISSNETQTGSLVKLK